MSTSSIVLHHSSYIQQPEWVTATLHRQLCGSTHVRQCNVKIYYASRKEKKRLHLLASIQCEAQRSDKKGQTCNTKLPQILTSRAAYMSSFWSQYSPMIHRVHEHTLDDLIWL